MTTLLAVLAGLATACSGGAASPSVPPPLALPPLDPQLQSFGEGALVFDITPSNSQTIDPLELAAEFGTPPPCSGFVFLFSWRTQNERSVSFAGNRQGGEFDIDSGPAGEASVSGCIALAAINDTSDPLEVEMRYIIAQPRP